MSRAAEDRLMRYLDGEASAADVAHVLQSLSRSARERALAANLREVGDVLREISDTRADGADDIAARVMACVDVRRDEPRLGRRWLGLVPVAGLVLAAAAAAVVFVRPTPSENAHRTSEIEPVARNLATRAIPMVISGVQDEGTSIESVDFGVEDGAIFLLPGLSGGTPVVWMTDAEPPSHPSGMK